MAGFIGPALPPELRQQNCNEEIEKGELIGPALPPGLQRNSATNDEKGELIGPALPKPSDGSDGVRIGPQLPPGFCDPTTSGSSEGDLTVQNKDKSPSTMYGPALPPGLDREDTSDPNLEEVEENDPDDVIGPMPLMGREKSNEGTSELDRRKTEIESRAKAMRDKLTGVNKLTEPEQPKREEWMTELPPEFKPLGLGPRKFRTTKSDTGDRSVWTDTPADQLKRAQGQQTKKKAASETYAAVLSKDRELTEQVAKYNEEYRSESLMEMHRKRRAKVLKEKVVSFSQRQPQNAAGEERNAGETERRPFNRETDLDLPKNLVTPAKRQALMKDSAKSLASKFTHGKQSFL